MPSEKIFNPDIKQYVECFLCEVKSIGGFSGSPVFVYIAPFTARPDTPQQLSSEVLSPWLLGINWGHRLDKERIRDKDGDLREDESYVNRNTGIACVAPAWCLTELLDDAELRLHRKQEDDKFGKETS